MKVSSVIAGASAALVAFQAALYASHGEADLLRPPERMARKTSLRAASSAGNAWRPAPISLSTGTRRRRNRRRERR